MSIENILKRTIENFRKSVNRPYSDSHSLKLKSETEHLLLECDSVEVDQSEEGVQRGQCIELAHHILETYFANKEPKLSNSVQTENTKSDTIIETMASISFKDVEVSLEKFDGKSRSVTSWFTGFEEIVDTCGWNAVQKLLFCRKLCDGSARLAIESTTDVGTYDKLKTFLNAEFESEVCSASIHCELGEMIEKKEKQQSILHIALNV